MSIDIIFYVLCCLYVNFNNINYSVVKNLPVKCNITYGKY